MNFWIHWGWLQFLCYTGFIFLVGSIFTALQHSKKFRDGVWYFVTFRWAIIHFPKKGFDWKHPLVIYKGKKPPKGFSKKVRPRPLHSGGPRRLDLDKQAHFLISKQGYDLDQAFDELQSDYIVFEIEKHKGGNAEKQKEYYNDPLEIKKLKANFKKRLINIIRQNFTQ